MQKKGQITIFIIVGIILLMVITGIFILKGQSVEKIEKKTPLTGAAIKNYVESCIQKTGEEALNFVGQHGGYYELPIQSNEKLQLPYYLYEGDNLLMSKEELEKQIGFYVDNEIFFCLQNFIHFEGFEIEQEEVHTSITVNSNSVLFDVNFPLRVRKGKNLKEIQDFSEIIPSKLGVVYDSVNRFMEGESSDSMCISCLTLLMTDNDLRSEITPVDEDGEMSFKIIADDGYEFHFMNWYQFVEEEVFVEDLIDE